MIGPTDEYPIHQIPAPIAWPATSDRNFYDRCYLNATNRTGDFFLITGLGYYPNLGTKDAFVLFRRGDTQSAVHLGDTIDQDRLNAHVNGYRIDVVEPLETLRIVLEETEGVAMDLVWEGSFPVLQELHHTLRQGPRPVIDAQRFAQAGSWGGVITIDGEQIDVDPSVWLGTRDRSWGIRPIGEPEPSGAPLNPPFDGLWWTYISMRFEDFFTVIIIQEDADGIRTANDCSRIDRDGKIEQLGWPQVSIHYQPGTRIPYGATLTSTLPDGTPVELEIESKIGMPLHIGGGYGGAAEWIHGMWKGEKFTERVDYDMTDEKISSLATFGAIDHASRGLFRIGTAPPVEGWGLFELATFGRHTPSGFSDWLSVSPPSPNRPRWSSLDT